MVTLWASNTLMVPKVPGCIALAATFILTTAALPANCASNQAPLKWQHNYTVAYLNALKLPIGADGMNSAGLSVGCLLFPGFAEFQVF